jgi:hypothetical protein
MSRQGIMANFSELTANPADDRMRRLASFAPVLLLAGPVVAMPDAGTLLFDDFEERARRVNEGELVFLATPPERPVHHHLTRLEITPEGLGSGWVVLQQCHDRIDRVPSAQIVYQPGKLRRLEIAGYRNIGSAWVEGDSVQLRNVAADAQLCVVAETRALHDLGEGQYELRNGPFMRQFLDGYFPMHVSLEVQYPDALELVDVDPPAQPGFGVRRSGKQVALDAWFEGRLSTVIRFKALGTDARD